MSVNISIGSIVSGKSGKPLKVLAVNGDVLEVSSDTDTFKVRRSAILKVIPPAARKLSDFLKSGDRVYIPACDKHGVIDRISHVEGKKGLFARVNRDDGITRDILLECLEVSQ